MKTDRTTKLMLALIAMALFLNAIVPLVQPAAVQAQQDAAIERHLRQISNDLRQFSNDFKRISDGSCFNDKIC